MGMRPEKPTRRSFFMERIMDERLGCVKKRKNIRAALVLGFEAKDYGRKAFDIIRGEKVMWARSPFEATTYCSSLVMVSP